jgi:hypothetical protein
MSAIGPNPPPIQPLILGPKIDPKVTAQQISEASQILQLSTLAACEEFNKSEYALPAKASSFTLASPGTENNPLRQSTAEGLSNSLGAILFFLVSMLQEMQKQINTKMSIASANLSIGQKNMEISGANASYVAGMAQADASRGEAKQQLIQGIASICLGVLSIGAAGLNAAKLLESSRAAAQGAATTTNIAQTGANAAASTTTGTASSAGVTIEMSSMAGKATAAGVGEAAKEAAVVGTKEATQVTTKAVAEGAAKVATAGAGATSNASNVANQAASSAVQTSVETTAKTAQTLMDKAKALLTTLKAAAMRAGPNELAQGITLAVNGAVSTVNSKINETQVVANKELAAVMQRNEGTLKAMANLFATVRSQFQEQLQSSDKLSGQALQALETYFANLASSLRG